MLDVRKAASAAGSRNKLEGLGRTMNESSFASLNPALLARKGGARPAMRPQLAPLDQTGPNVASNLEDLGWNDMGEEHALAHGSSEDCVAQVLHLTPEPCNEKAEAETRAHDKAAQDVLNTSNSGGVRRQQEDLAERISKAVPARKVTRRSALSRGKRAAFTLRLDEERHLKLRLLSTVRGRSAQQIVTEALDAMLQGMDDIESLAAQVNRR